MVITTKTIDIRNEQIQLAELLLLARQGVEVILTDGSTPLVRVVPLQTTITPPRIAGLHAHLGPAWMSDDFDDPLPDEFWTKSASM